MESLFDFSWISCSKREEPKDQRGDHVEELFSQLCAARAGCMEERGDHMHQDLSVAVFGQISAQREASADPNKLSMLQDQYEDYLREREELSSKVEDIHKDVKAAQKLVQQHLMQDQPILHRRAIVDLAAVRNKLVDAHTRLAELDRWFEDTHTSGYMHLPGGAPGSSAAAHRAPDASAQQTNTEPGRLCISPGQPGSDEAGRPGGRRISLSPTAKERARRGSAPSLHAPLSTVPPLPSPRRLRAPATDMLEGSDSVASSTPRSRRSSETVNLLRERRDSEEPAAQRGISPDKYAGRLAAEQRLEQYLNTPLQLSHRVPGGAE